MPHYDATANANTKHDRVSNMIAIFGVQIT